MQNPVVKIAALVGVVGIGALVMLQAQREMTRPAEVRADAESEAGVAPTADPAAAPSEEGELSLGAQKEPDEEHAGRDHAGHDHADHKQADGAEAFQSSGLDFRKPAGADASAKPAGAPGLLDDPNTNDPAHELKKNEPAAKTAAAAPNSLDDDPFGQPAGKAKPSAAAAAHDDKHPQAEPIKATSHESDPAHNDAASTKPEVEPAAGEPAGAGPQLIDPSANSGAAPEPASDGAPKELKTDGAEEKTELKSPTPAPAKEEGAPAVADELDPFGDANAAKAKPELGKNAKKEPKPEKETGAPAELDDLGPSLGPKKEITPAKTADAKDDSDFPKSKGRRAPKAEGNPEPNPKAFDQLETPSADPAHDHDVKPVEEKSKEPAPLEAVEEKPLKADEPQTLPMRVPEKSEHSDKEPAANDGPNISPGTPDPHAAKELPQDGAKPKALAPSPDSTTDAASSEEFHGDGTIGGDAPRGPQRPQLTIEKVAPPNAQLGQPLIYSIFVKNVGNSTAHEVVVEDRIPKGSKLSGTIPRAELAGKTLIWKLGDLKPDEQRKISIRVVPVEAGQIGSVATVNFVAEVAAETQITAPQLRIDLVGPSEAKLGEAVPFQFRVTNTGSGEASGVVIRDIIPEGLKHAAGNDLEYEVGKLPPGQSREIKLALTAAKVGPTVNRAVVTAEGGVTSEAKVALEIYGAKLVVKRTGPSKRYVGRDASYTNTITNESPRPVDTVTVTETVPEGMEFIEASNGAQYNEGSRTIAWRLNRMAGGEERVLKVKLKPKSTGSLTSVVRAAATGGDVVETTSQTLVEGYAAVGVEMESVDGPVDVGEKVTLHIVARNRGNSPATNVAVTIEVPEQFKIVSARGPSKHEQSGNEVRFEAIPAVDGRTTAAIDLVLEARAKGDARVKVQIKGDQLSEPLTREESIMVLSDGQ